jgi:hypothetical protein
MIDATALAAWNAANARARATYHAERSAAEGWCRTCGTRRRYRENAMCAPCLHLMRAIRGTV